ncbi:MAG: cytochrome c-type biogenesis protein [Gammaproteobacteria bacterium]
MIFRNWRFVILLVLIGISGLPGTSAIAMDVDPPLADPAQQEVYERLIHEVRCLVCQNQTIADSSAPLAADLRKEVRELAAAGRSGDEIKTFLLDRYGDFVLYRPRFTLETAFLWLAPGLLLLAGGLALGRIVRRRAALPVPPEDPVDDPPIV